MNGGIINKTFYLLAKLVRLPNLIILMITLYVIAVYGIHPPMVSNGITPALTNKEYYLFIFIITCIGAGGYVYNDIVDQKTDSVNDKRKTVGHSITKNLALALYWFITLTPLLAVLSLVMEMNEPNYIWYYCILVFLFWFYNIYLQKKALLGNLTVASLCALTVLVPYALENKAFDLLNQVDPITYSHTFNGILFFSMFCFLANFIREIIKDIEDTQGDQEAGYQTLPIVIGITKTKYVVIGLTAIFIILLLAWALFYAPIAGLVGLLTVVMLLLPLVVIIWQTYGAEQPKDFQALSQYWKLYLLIGIFAYILISN